MRRAVQQTAAEVVQLEIRIDAAPSIVFEFLIDPAKMVRWMGTEAGRGGSQRGKRARRVRR